MSKLKTLTKVRFCKKCGSQLSSNSNRQMCKKCLSICCCGKPKDFRAIQCLSCAGGYTLTPAGQWALPLEQRIAAWLKAEARWIKRREIGARYPHDQMDGVRTTAYRRAIALADGMVDRGLVERRIYCAPKGQRSYEYRWIKDGTAPAAEEGQNGE